MCHASESWHPVFLRTLDSSFRWNDTRSPHPGLPLQGEGIKKIVSQPISRVLSRTIIHLGYISLYTSSDLPRSYAGSTIGSLFGLAPDGVYPATTVANSAVRSYRTISPLPFPKKWRYIFCGTFRRLAPPRRYLALCPLEPGLSSTKKKLSSDCLTDSMVLSLILKIIASSPKKIRPVCLLFYLECSFIKHIFSLPSYFCCKIYCFF